VKITKTRLRKTIKRDKATKFLAMVEEIDPKLAQDIVKEALKWKKIKEKTTT
jgi:hypothetical protein